MDGTMFRPSYSAVQTYAGTWTDFNGTGGSSSDIPNMIAGVGGAWGTAPFGYATRFQNQPYNHADIMARCGLPKRISAGELSQICDPIREIRAARAIDDTDISLSKVLLVMLAGT